MKSLSCVRLLATPWTAAYQAPLSMGFSRQKYWSVVPLPSPFCFIDYAKAFDCVAHSKLWKILKEMGIQDYLTCLLRNLYAGQKQQLETDTKRISNLPLYMRGCIFANSLKAAGD